MIITDGDIYINLSTVEAWSWELDEDILRLNIMRGGSWALAPENFWVLTGAIDQLNINIICNACVDIRIWQETL